MPPYAPCIGAHGLSERVADAARLVWLPRDPAMWRRSGGAAAPSLAALRPIHGMLPYAERVAGSPGQASVQPQGTSGYAPFKGSGVHLHGLLSLACTFPCGVNARKVPPPDQRVIMLADLHLPGLPLQEYRRGCRWRTAPRDAAGDRRSRAHTCTDLGEEQALGDLLPIARGDEARDLRRGLHRVERLVVSGVGVPSLAK